MNVSIVTELSNIFISLINDLTYSQLVSFIREIYEAIDDESFSDQLYCYFLKKDEAGQFFLFSKNGGYGFFRGVGEADIYY